MSSKTETGNGESVTFNATDKEVIQIEVRDKVGDKIRLNKGDIMTYTSSSDSNLTRYIQIAQFRGNEGNEGNGGKKENITGIIYKIYQKSQYGNWSWYGGGWKSNYVIKPDNQSEGRGNYWYHFNNLKKYDGTKAEAEQEAQEAQEEKSPQNGGNGNGGKSSEPAPTEENTQGHTAKKPPLPTTPAPPLTPEEEAAKAAAEGPADASVGERAEGAPTGSPAGNGEGGEIKDPVYDPVKALNEKDGMNNLNKLSDAIKEQTGFIEKYNKDLEKKFAAMRRKITDAVKDAEKIVGKIGLEKAAIEAINTELGNVHKKIMGSIGVLETQVNAYGDTLKGANGNSNGEGDSDDESENDKVKPQTSRPWWSFRPKQVNGGYKSTPRTRKHRKTYRFTATPKSQTMKKRHRTHKKAKKQAKKQNKQRK